MSALLIAYDRALQRRPILVKTVTSALLFAAGDSIAQTLEKEEGQSFDRVRLLRMLAWGGMFAPLAHGWYGLLERMVPGAGAGVVVRKLALDQLTWTPVINCAFFWTTSLIETGDPSAGVAKIREILWPTLKVNWVVWPVLQSVNLSIVPLQYRLLYVNVASLFWSAFLSSQAAAGAPQAEAAPAGAAPAAALAGATPADAAPASEPSAAAGSESAKKMQ